jgi:two-component system, LuxR family, response regulator FixJ
MALNATVFVVDDGSQGGEAVGALARSLGWDVAVYASAEAFLRALPSWGEGPGCLVAPLRNAARNGADPHDEVQRCCAAISVVLLAERPATDSVVRAMRAGALTVLDKPWDNGALELAIREGLALDAQRRRERGRQLELHERMATLTGKEHEVLRLIVAGKPNKTMASQLGASLRTVENRRRSVFAKLGVRSVTELVAAVLAAENGSVD